MVEFFKIHHPQHVYSKEVAPFEESKDIDASIKKAANEYIKLRKFIVIVAENEGTLIGYTCGRIIKQPEKVLDKEGYVEDLFVTERLRNKNLGKTLLDTLEKEFKKRGCNHMSLDTYKTNDRAIDFYHREGFIDRLLTIVKKI